MTNLPKIQRQVHIHHETYSSQIHAVKKPIPRKAGLLFPKHYSDPNYFQNGLLDAAIVHQPDYWPELHAQKILEEKLVLIRSKKSADPYVYVDWGENFKQKHDAALPFLTKNKLSFDLGPLALQFILQTSGSGYFRARVVQPYLQQGDIELVEGSPEFSFPIYLIHIDLETNPKLEKAIDALLEVTRHEPAWNP